MKVSPIFNTLLKQVQLKQARHFDPSGKSLYVFHENANRLIDRLDVSVLLCLPLCRTLKERDLEIS